jgi:glycerophosphoryl diester phosphodiesterase
VSEFYRDDRPLNLAHRGASEDAPQNTMAAFLLAAELGADGVELDAQLSADGHVVVIHDLSVDATTDGRGPVRAKSLAELKELDAGGWFAPVFAGERIPSLNEVFARMGSQADGSDTGCVFNVELKSDRQSDERLAAEVMRLVETHGLERRTVISSFESHLLRQVQRYNPQVATALLFGPERLFLPRRGVLGLSRTPSWPVERTDAMHPHYTLVSQQYVDWARQKGYRVNVWTVDDPGDMWRMIRLGVDGIITNRPLLLQQVLAERR